MGHLVLLAGGSRFYYNGASFSPRSSDRVLLTRREAAQVSLTYEQHGQVEYVPEVRL